LRTRAFTLVITALLLLSVAVAACSTPAPTSPAAQALMDTANTGKTRAADEASAAAADAALTVGDQAFTLDDLAGLATATASTEDGDVTGASLLAVLEAAGISAETISLVASDGYSADVVVAEIDDTAVLAIEDGKVNAVIPTVSKGSWVKDIVSITAQ